jgi:AcrR family transcriptional regulator
MSPRNPEQLESIRSQSKQRILDAAFELMAKNGYEATSISTIARRANISKGLLYNYFESKEELLKTLVQSAFDEGDHLMGDLIGDKPDVTLKNLLQWYFRELKERSEFWKLLTALSLQVDKFPFVREIVNSKLNEYGKFIGGLLSQLGFEHAREEGLLIAALFDGLGMHYIILREDYPLDEMERFLINKYCNSKNQKN